jgi:hypothetical protein
MALRIFISGGTGFPPANPSGGEDTDSTSNIQHQTPLARGLEELVIRAAVGGVAGHAGGLLGFVLGGFLAEKLRLVALGAEGVGISAEELGEAGTVRLMTPEAGFVDDRLVHDGVLVGDLLVALDAGVGAQDGAGRTGRRRIVAALAVFIDVRLVHGEEHDRRGRAGVGDARAAGGLCGAGVGNAVEKEAEGLVALLRRGAADPREDASRENDRDNGLANAGGVRMGRARGHSEILWATTVPSITHSMRIESGTEVSGFVPHMRSAIRANSRASEYRGR